ncbi:MAG: hypothetical protein QM817_26975 [Archangium sp.]
MTRINTAARNTTNRKPLDFDRLETRVARQESRLAQGLRAGTLSQDEAQKLKSRLDGVQSKLQSDGFDAGSQGREVGKELRGIGKEMKGLKKDDQVDPAKRMDNIDRRIAKGLENGSLTPDEAEALKQKATDLRAKLDAAKTPEEKAALGKELQALSKEVHKEKHDGELDFEKRKTSFENRIAAGVSDGSLTEQEASQLREKLQGVGADANSINSLSRDIWRARHDSQMNTEAAGANLNERVRNLENQGSLPADQASAMKERLLALTQPGATSSGAQLNELRSGLSFFG